MKIIFFDFDFKRDILHSFFFWMLIFVLSFVGLLGYIVYSGYSITTEEISDFFGIAWLIFSFLGLFAVIFGGGRC